MNKVLLGISAVIVGLTLSLGSWEVGTRLARADDTPALLVDAGATVMPAPVLVVLPTAAPRPQPSEHPAAALSDAQLARKTSWPLAIYFVLVALGKALAYGRNKVAGVPLLGRLAAWLAVGKRAVIAAALGAVGPAGYDVLVNGGTTMAAIIASAIAAAGIMSSTTKPTTAAPDVPGAKSAAGALVLLVALGLGASQLTACGTSAQQRQTTLQAALATTDATCAALAAYDLKHQEDLKAAAHASGATNAEVTDTMAKWRTARAPALKACKTALDAIKAGATLTDDQSIKALTAAAGDVADALKTLGVSL